MEDQTKIFLEQLKELELAARLLEPDMDVRTNWDRAVLQYGHNFIDALDDLPAFNGDGSKASLLSSFDIQEEGRSIEELLELLAMAVDSTGLNPASGGHMGYIPGGGIYGSALADYLAAVGNRYAGIKFASPGAVEMERYLLRWMCALFAYPEGSGGTLCSGGSVANLTAIVAARDASGMRAAEFEHAVIYMTEHTHHCMHKAYRIAGLGECRQRQIQRDKKDRMSPAALREQIILDIQNGFRPFMVVASLGSTDTGAVDEVSQLADICEEFNIWLHVDAAYGGFFILLPELIHLFYGINRADSIVIDPHKGLFLPYGLGAVLLKRERDLLPSHHYLANYMQDAYQNQQEYSPADLSIELTRHFRALRLWLPLHLHGLKPFKACLSEKYYLAKYAAAYLASLPYVELRVDPELSVVCFRLLGAESSESLNDLNRRFIQYIHQDGEVFLSSTSIEGQIFIRMAILSFRTHKSTVDKAFEKLNNFAHINNMM